MKEQYEDYEDFSQERQEDTHADATLDKLSLFRKFKSINQQFDFFKVDVAYTPKQQDLATNPFKIYLQTRRQSLISEIGNEYALKFNHSGSYKGVFSNSYLSVFVNSSFIIKTLQLNSWLKRDEPTSIISFSNVFNSSGQYHSHWAHTLKSWDRNRLMYTLYFDKNQNREPVIGGSATLSYQPHRKQKIQWLTILDNYSTVGGISASFQLNKEQIYKLFYRGYFNTAGNHSIFAQLYEYIEPKNRVPSSTVFQFNCRHSSGAAIFNSFIQWQRVKSQASIIMEINKIIRVGALIGTDKSLIMLQRFIQNGKALKALKFYFGNNGFRTQITGQSNIFQSTVDYIWRFRIKNQQSQLELNLKWNI